MEEQKHKAIYEAVINFDFVRKADLHKNDERVASTSPRLSSQEQEIAQANARKREIDRFEAEQDDRKFEAQHFSNMPSTVQKALEQDLSRELKETYNLDVNIDILTTRSGSYIVFFCAAISVIGMVLDPIAKYRDLYDSFLLIQSQAKRILQVALNHIPTTDQGKVKHTVDVILHDPHSAVSEKESELQAIDNAETQDKKLNNDDIQNRKLNNLQDAPIITSSVPGPRVYYAAVRDEFFYFLLIFSIVEFVIIGILVWTAVAKTYFQ